MSALPYSYLFSIYCRYAPCRSVAIKGVVLLVLVSPELMACSWQPHRGLTALCFLIPVQQLFELKNVLFDAVPQKRCKKDCDGERKKNFQPPFWQRCQVYICLLNWECV